MPRRDYTILIGHSILRGLFGGLLTILYLLVIEGGVQYLWGEIDQVGWFSGSWQTIAIPIGAGLLVGALYRQASLPPGSGGSSMSWRRARSNPRPHLVPC